MIIGVQVKFDSCHHLPSYDGKCKRLHGHTWHMTVEFAGPVQESGFVCDFTQIKKIVNDLVKDLDHTDLNKLLDNPTCENLVNLCWDSIRYALPFEPFELYRLELREGDGGYAYRVKG